jgi:hypothetical protein
MVSRLALALCLVLGACTPEVEDLIYQDNFCDLVKEYLPIEMSRKDTRGSKDAMTKLNIFHACKCIPEAQRPPICKGVK